MRKSVMRAAQAVVSLSTIALCMSCFGISQKDYPEVRYYSLDPVMPSNDSSQKVDAAVALKSFSSSHGAADSQFLLRHEGSRVERDFYNRFIASPIELIEDSTHLWLQKSDAFESVLAYDAGNSSDVTIAGHVVKLEGDFSSTPPMAVLAIQFYVTPSDGTGTSLTRSYEELLPIANATASSLVEGWNSGLALILGNFEEDLVEYLQSR